MRGRLPNDCIWEAYTNDGFELKVVTAHSHRFSRSEITGLAHYCIRSNGNSGVTQSIGPKVGILFQAADFGGYPCV